MKRQSRLTFSSVVANTLFFLVATLIAASAWWPIYQDVRFVIAVGAATVLGATIAILGAAFRWPAAVVLPLTVLAFAVFGVPLAVPDQAALGLLPTFPGLIDLFAGVVFGWKQLLTIALPVGSYQSLLVPIFVASLFSAVISLTFALRAKHGEVAVLAPIALFITGIAFGSRQAEFPILLALSLTIVVLLWLMWRRWYRRRQAIRLLGYGSNQRVLGARPVLSAFVVLAIASIAAVGATQLLPPSGERQVLRYAIEQPFDPRAYPSPLVGFRGYLKGSNPDESLFSVTGLDPGTRIRIATLDTYDGIIYAVGSSEITSESGSFTRVASSVDQSAVVGDQASIDVSILGYRGVWLPVVGKFEKVEFSGTHAAELRDSFYYNNTSGTAAVIGGLSQGDRYHLDLVLPREPSASELEFVTAGASSVPPLKVPAELSTRLEEYTGSVDGQGAKLVAMINGIRSDGYISHGVGPNEPVSRSGHSADRITELLTEQRMIGDAEQYSVAAAIMARGLGFPSRVVFGFTIPDRASAVGENGAGFEVTGSMVSAWIEVNTAEYGWVTIDPNPEMREIPEELPEDPSTVSRPQAVIQPPVEETDLSERQTPNQSVEEPPAAPEPWVAIVLGILRALAWLALVVALVLSPFLAILALKARRRAARRSATTPQERITGGWREFEDAVVDHGIAAPPAATRREFAAAFGGPRSIRAAAVADRAVFAPDAPSDSDAEELWQAVDALTSLLAVGRTRWQRLVAKFSARSLGSYSVKVNGSRRGSVR